MRFGIVVRFKRAELVHYFDGRTKPSLRDVCHNMIFVSFFYFYAVAVNIGCFHSVFLCFGFGFPNSPQLKDNHLLLGKPY